MKISQIIDLFLLRSAIDEHIFPPPPPISKPEETTIDDTKVGY
jgi:hypothetical protein